MWNPSRHVYSRYTQSVSSRAERVLSKINVGTTPHMLLLPVHVELQNGYAITFASGIAAAYAVRTASP